MTHPARIDYDRLLAGELNPLKSNELREHARSCGDCRAYLAALEADGADLLRRLPPNAFTDRVMHRAGFTRRPMLRWALAGAAVVLLLAGVVSGWWWQRRGGTEPGTRWMGGAQQIRVYLERPGEPANPLETQPRVGDRLRFEVVLPPGRTGYAALVALDGGRAQAVLPADPLHPPFPVSGSTLLPGSAAVEPGGGRVQLVLVVRETPFQLAALLQELQQADREGTLQGILGLAYSLAVDLDAP